MRGKRGPVQASLHPIRNKDQQRAANWIQPLIFWGLGNAAEGPTWIGLIVVWRESRNSERVERDVGECERSKELVPSPVEE